MVDLVIRGGRLCDGSGAPAREADVAIDGGRIVGISAIGTVPSPGRHQIDARGLVVAPGFVDVHTHYDAQVTWDPLLTPSSWHGVTTAVVGNCGFALAPCRPGEGDGLLRMLEHVEGMPLESLRAGVRFDWESVGDYVAMLRGRPLGPNVGVLIGHSTLRAYVMGDDAYAREARPAEIAAMAALVRDGMAAGALGLATSFSPAHVGDGGRPVPSRRATRAELDALADAMPASGRGVLEITPRTFPLADDELAWLQALAARTGRPVSFSAVLDLPDRDGVWEPVYERLRDGHARGARVWPQVSCRPMRFDFDLVTGCASLDTAPCWARFRRAGSHDARIALLRDAAFREDLRAQTIGRHEAPSSRRWNDVVLEEAVRAEHGRWLGASLGTIAAERGGDAIDALLDVALAEDLRARFSMLLVNYDDDRVAALLRQPESLVALSDAGAHVSVLCDAGYATHLLGHWVRELGVLSWEEGVHRLTAMPAAIYGIDRGRLIEGAVADVVCFDPERVGSCPPERVRDFPAGASRWIVRATGIEHVLVAGEPLIAGGEATGRLPGRVV
jgi:N-acyl-D-aspartate/D-glutamate deacylase